MPQRHSPVPSRFLEDGGTGILAGDGALNYGLEKALETYYNFALWKSVHSPPTINSSSTPPSTAPRPVSVLGARLHWEF